MRSWVLDALAHAHLLGVVMVGRCSLTLSNPR
jgi:hypothetical protein